MLLLLVLLVGSAHAWGFEDATEAIKKAAMVRFLGYDPKCTYSRENAISCFSKYVDLNKDGKITLVEINEAEDKYLSWELKLLKWVVGWKIDVSPKSIMRDCGPDDRGEFTPDSFRRTAKTCIASQEALCLVKIGCDHLDKRADSSSFGDVKAPRVPVGEEKPKKSGWFW
jgi:hypothetical protein